MAFSVCQLAMISKIQSCSDRKFTQINRRLIPDHHRPFYIAEADRKQSCLFSVVQSAVPFCRIFVSRNFVSLFVVNFDSFQLLIRHFHQTLSVQFT